MVRPFHIVNAKNCDLALILVGDGRCRTESRRGWREANGLIGKQAVAVPEGLGKRRKWAVEAGGN